MELTAARGPATRVFANRVVMVLHVLVRRIKRIATRTIAANRRRRRAESKLLVSAGLKGRLIASAAVTEARKKTARTRRPTSLSKSIENGSSFVRRELSR